MFKLIFALVAIVFVGAFAVFAQEKLPEFGDIADLKSMSKVYVIADSTQARKFVLGELKKYKSLEVADSPEEGQFILECKQIGHVAVGATGGMVHEMPTFEMTAYTTLKDGRHRIAWSETKTSLRPAEELLTRDFLNALKKSRGEKK